MARGRDSRRLSSGLRPAGGGELRIDPNSPLGRAMTRCGECQQNSATPLVGGLCTECREERAAQIAILEEYVAKNGLRPAWEVMRDTNLPSSLILSFLNTRATPSHLRDRWRDASAPQAPPAPLRRDPVRMPDQSPMHSRDWSA